MCFQYFFAHFSIIFDDTDLTTFFIDVWTLTDEMTTFSE